MQKLPLIAALVAAPAVAFAQQIVVGPYLQEASPTAVHVRWETDSGEQSRVEWGASEVIDQVADGPWWGSGLGQTLHEASITGLQPATRYWYRVVTDGASAGPFDFTTPPVDGPVRLVAVSDMQQDSGNPDVFETLVAGGLLPWIEGETGLGPGEGVDAVLIPGDLVDNGWDYGSWASEFFGPGAPLFRHAAVYPVPGNHEADSPTFFDYFRLPQDGTAGYEEHWWSHRISNVLVVGLDSNPGYTITEQLDWLDGTLAAACDEESLDFVFAQLHHPFKSELWLPGENLWSGRVVERLERFSTDCDKPSIHFFGHTHGYSRGQSRDHRHLWVNVATAGGNIDYWGEYAQNDYEEFVISEDEWGFVVVEVTAGDDPGFRLRRLSQGDEYVARTAALTDDVTVRRFEAAPATPQALSPSDDVVEADGALLVASEAGDVGASQFQVARGCDFDEPVIDVWRQSRDEYDEVDRMAGVDLGELWIEGLPARTEHCWRVRYRSLGLVWSPWSAAAPFATGESAWTGELLTNGDAEGGVDGWTIAQGNLESLAESECDAVAPHGGERCFSVGGNCAPQAFGEAHQEVGLVLHQAAVDDGRATARLRGWLRTWGGDDQPTVEAVFLDGEGTELGRTEQLTTQAAAWTQLELEATVPPGSRRIRVRMTGTRNAGDDNDSYVDDLSLRLRTDPVATSDDDPVDEGTPADGCGRGGSLGLLLLVPLAWRRRL